MGAYVKQSVCESCKTNKEILEKIYDNALSFRKRAVISYRPYQVQEFIDMVRQPGVDFADFYPDFREGDYAWFSSCMDGMFERNMLINVKTNCNVEIYFNGEKQQPVPGPDDTLDVFLNFRKGQNRLLVKIIAKKDGFAAYAAPLVPELRYGAGGDYAYCTWHYIEKEGFRLQSALELSRIYRSEEAEPAPKRDAIDWVYPVMPQQSNKKEFDFSALCCKGASAYVHTYVSGNITIKHDSPLKVFADGKEIYLSDEAYFKRSIRTRYPF